MKTRFAIVLAVLSALVTGPVCGEVNFSAGVQINTPGVGLQINAVGDFYAPLTPYGTWVTFGTYGRCWHPIQVAADWRPYCNGSWEWTDAGWYWNSDESWAWACYHYGSWEHDSSVGWVWIPGTDWAPAWVTWRYSDDYVGWAPCGPGLTVLAPPLFVFCDAHHFNDHFSPRTLIVNNRTIIERTREVKTFSRQTVNFDGHQRTIFANKGPGTEVIQRATGTKFTPRPIAEVARGTRQPENVRGNENRPAENRPPEQQRYNQEQRPKQEPNRETPPPTGKEQPRQYEQPQEPSHDQRVMPLQPQQRSQQHPDAMSPTGRDQQRNYSQPPNQGQQRQQQAPAHEQPFTPKATPPERATPPEKPLTPTGREKTPNQGQERQPQAPPREQPSTPKAPPPERVTPSEKPLAPTGRENAPASERKQEVKPSQAPEQRPPAQAAPGQEKKDNKDRQPVT